MTVHHRPHTLADHARFQCACGWHTEIPSLLDRLYDALPGAQGIGHSAARSLPPIWLDAARLYACIDTQVRKWQVDYPHCAQTLPATRRLETLRTKRWRPQDTALITDYATQLEAWVIEIDVLLTPEPVRALWAAEGGGFAACPACDKTMAKKCVRVGEPGGTLLQPSTDATLRCRECSTTWAENTFPMKCPRSGEIVGTPALQLMSDGATHCLACTTDWSPQQATWVCRMLGYPLPSGVLQ